METEELGDVSGMVGPFRRVDARWSGGVAFWGSEDGVCRVDACCHCCAEELPGMGDAGVVDEDGHAELGAAIREERDARV